MKRILITLVASLVSTLAVAVELKTFTDGPVLVRAKFESYHVEKSTKFSTVGYVKQRIAAGELPAELTYEVSVVPRSGEMRHEGNTIPANEMVMYCNFDGQKQLQDASSWVPFVRDAVGQPLTLYAMYDLVVVAKRDGQVAFERTYEVRVEREARGSRFKNPCADQVIPLGVLYQETLSGTFQKAIGDMKLLSQQAALAQ